MLFANAGKIVHSCAPWLHKHFDRNTTVQIENFISVIIDIVLI